MVSIYNKEFKYKGEDGSDLSMVLKPLPVKYLPVLFKCASKMPTSKDGSDVSTESFMKILGDEKFIEDLTSLCIASVKRSVESLSDEQVDSFVSIHFLELFPEVITLNLKTK